MSTDDVGTLDVDPAEPVAVPAAEFELETVRPPESEKSGASASNVQARSPTDGAEDDAASQPEPDVPSAASRPTRPGDATAPDALRSEVTVAVATPAHRVPEGSSPGRNAEDRPSFMVEMSGAELHQYKHRSSLVRLLSPFIEDPRPHWLLFLYFAMGVAFGLGLAFVLGTAPI